MSNIVFPVKKPVKKREIPLSDETDLPKKSGSILSKYNKTIDVKATLREKNTATYHGDYFYKYLTQKTNEHKEFINWDDLDVIYKQYYTAIEFKFTYQKQGLIHKNKQGFYCKEEDLIDKLCMFKLRVIPYDIAIENTSQRIVGISIKVTEIREI